MSEKLSKVLSLWFILMTVEEEVMRWKEMRQIWAMGRKVMEGWDGLGATGSDFGLWFSCPVVRRPVPAVGPASYLAVHEFQVDSFQRDLQQPPFPSFHVLDRKLST